MKRAAAIMLALSLALGLNGCGSGLTIFSNYRRLENIELVRTVTADAEGGDITATVYSDAGKESDPRMYQRTASSIGVALGELQLMALGRVALLSHTENMLIGEELAAESLGECLDYVERYSEMRLDTGLMIVREGTARELVSGLSGPDAPSSDVIKGFADNISRAGQGYVFSCREIIASLCENGYALAMCVAGEKAEDKLFESRGELDIRPRGLAVLTAEGISGFLDDEETTGALLVLSKYRSKDMDIPVGDTVVTLDLDGFETQVRPVFDREGALRGMKIKLHVSANIINLSGTAEVSRRDYRERAQDELSRELREAIEAAVGRSQEMGIDFLDLRGFAARAEPIKLQDMPGSFEEALPDLEVEVTAESSIRRTYDIMDPPQTAKDKEVKNPWENLIESLRDS